MKPDLRRSNGAPSSLSAADALFGEGNALMAHARPADALACYDRALAFRPDWVAARNNRGVALRALGRAAEALASFDAALSVESGHCDALNNRGKALVDLGRAIEALECFDKALATGLSRARTLNNRGNTLMKLGRAAEALADYEAALALEPGAADAHNNRGTALRELKRHEEALEAFERALALLPGNVEIVINLADVHLDLGLAADALRGYDSALAARPDHARAHDGRGNALARLGREQEALASYDRAIALDPLAASAYNNRGLALMQSGRVAEGARLIETAIGLDAASGMAFYNLSLAKTFAPGDPLLDSMEALARAAPSSDVDGRTHIHFALGKAYSDLGRFESSFRHFSLGNGLQRARCGYDEGRVLGDIERVRELYSTEAMARLRGRGDPSPVPIFVFGMPRSGTTLVEQILASHPEVHGAGEIKDFALAAAGFGALANEISAAPWNRVGAHYVGRLRAAAPTASRVVDKMTENFRFAGAIALALPNARMIHVQRDPLDVCVSCFCTLFAEALPWAYDLPELGRYYRAYETLMDHWRAALPEGMMLEVRYEDVIGDMEGQARRMLGHCGLDWDPRCLDFHRGERSVRTASFAQVRRPLYNSSVGRWRNFEAFLAPLAQALGR